MDMHTRLYRPASSEQLTDKKLQGTWQDMSESNKGKSCECDGECGKKKLVWR